MAIRTYQYCDMCEDIHGKESDAAEILRADDQPAFPQLIWTYYRKTLAIGNQDGNPVIFEHWAGAPNRLEFCEKHAMQFNTLIKAFFKNDSRILGMLDNLVDEDEKAWAQKQADIQKEFAQLAKAHASKTGKKEV